MNSDRQQVRARNGVHRRTKSRGKKGRGIFFLLAATLVTLWIPNVATIPEELPLHSVFVCLMGLLVVGTVGASAWKGALRTPGFKWILFSTIFLGCFAAASFVWSAEPFRVFRVAYAMGSGAAVFLVMTWYCRTPDATLRLFKVYAFAMTIWVIVLTCIKFIPSLHPVFVTVAGERSAQDLLEGRDRFSGFFKHPNQYGIALSAAFGPLLALAVTPGNVRGFGRIVLWLGVVAGITSIILSGSKANILLGVAITGYVGFALSIAAKQFSVILIRSFGVGLVVLLLVAVGSAFLEYLNPRAFRILDTFFTQEAQAVSSINTRNIIWEHSWRIGVQNPVFGTGAGSRIFGFSHSHNFLLDYFRSMGIPGLAAALCLVTGVGIVALRCLRSSRQLPRGVAGLFPILIGSSAGAITYTVSNLSSDSFGPATILFFYFNLGFACAALRQVGELRVLKRIKNVALAARPTNQAVGESFPQKLKQV